MTEKKADTLHTLRKSMRFHKAMGINEYPLNQDVQRFLEIMDRPKIRSGKRSVVSESVGTPPFRGIDKLVTEINACTLCRLSRDPWGRVPGKGSTTSRLMIVGDWSLQSGAFSPDLLFGKEEDVMLWKMMAAIGLQADQVYATNCLKCCPKAPEVIDKKCEESCFSFLAREIAAVNPLVICAMGELSVRVLMDRKDPLARLRGRFGSYRYQSGQNVVIMPTFHPRFLLQQPEMKKATWNDLLAIKRRLDEP